MARAAAGSLAAPVKAALVKADSRLGVSAGHDEGAAGGNVGASCGVVDTKRLGGGSAVATAGVGDAGAAGDVAATRPKSLGDPVAKLESWRTFAVTSEIEPRPEAWGAMWSVSGPPSPGCDGKPTAARSAAELPSVARLSATSEASPVGRVPARQAAASCAARAAAATKAVDVEGQSNRARTSSPSPSTHAEGTCATWIRLVMPGR